MPLADRRHHATCWPPGLHVAHGFQPAARPRWEMAVPFITDREIRDVP